MLWNGTLKKIASDAWISTLWSILRGHVIIFIWKWRNGHISAQGLKMNKRRPLSFLQLQKFEKTKWACFIHFWPLGRDMAIFSFFPQFNSCLFFWDTLYTYSRLYQPKHPNVLRWNWSNIRFTCSAGLAWWKWPLKDSLLEQKWPKNVLSVGKNNNFRMLFQ